MTYRGRVQNGVVVLEAGTALEDGTPVRVEPEDPVASPRGSAEAVMRHAGIWAAQASEVDQSLAELRRAKQASKAESLQLF